MTSTCGQCLTANPAAARFCMGCGGGLAQAAAKAPGLRFVTVAFCDIAGSTQLALRFDPQVWHGILETYFTGVGGALVAAGGRLEKFIGDAVVGVFGADAAGEDDAVHAVQGALDALAQLELRNQDTIGRHGIRLSIRFGIASGRVVLADRDSSFAIGSVMNRAARLQSAAPADGTVVDVRTWLLVRDRLACLPVPPVPAKGFDKPLQAWSVTRDGTPGSAEPVFVNQTDVLSRLTTALDRAAAQPTTSTIPLVGELGSGKTRILRRLAAHAADRGMRTVSVACRGNDEGLWRLQQLDRELGGRSQGGGTPSTAELQWRVRARLLDLSRQGPLVVLVDDFHRCPDVLRPLFEPVPDPPGPIVFVLADREPPVAAVPAIAVPPLSAAHSRDLLAALGRELPPSAAGPHPLLERSRGNPLLLEQLSALAADGIDDDVAPSAEAALGSRIERLAEPTRQVLACLGAWGTELRPGDLDAACEIDESGLAAALGELQSLGLAANRTAAEVAYAHLGLRDRARLHAAIATRLREYARTEPALLELAASHAGRAQRHWREFDPGSVQDGQATRLAAECLVAAARQAVGRSEVRAAAESAARARELGVPDDDLTLEIAALESYALGASGQVPEALERIARVRSLPGNPSARLHLAINQITFGTGDLDQARELAGQTDDPGARARLDTLEGQLAARRGDYPTAEAFLRSAHDGMRAFGGGLGLAEVYGNLSLFLMYADQPPAEAAAACLALRQEVADAPIMHAVVGCAAAVLLQRGGDTPAAAAMLDRAHAVFGEMGHVQGQAGAHEFSSVAAELRGDLAAATAAILRARDVYAAAGAATAAARCGVRAFVLDPDRPAPDLSALAAADSWDLRVLLHQLAALRAADRAEALSRLDRALAVIAAIRGRGATLVPLAGCLRIAARLGDQARVAEIENRMGRVAVSSR
ncbi:adenylate/guanylate cyclase domain-containing protein [Catellatospora sp. KI3]|uniref:adenylate/guanylate cyclase domain-containing protein n=1 Tax=Catellatospora sp. KI3 TaxID=3041620 RepID=UPI0024827C57|nr:adenylate/guanylate cyclase domain-containing protein [Catellatospora sp. KI3]MDI1465212.1 adenylate/guanylate cyclase domain-containing protein [Catellatospora sp. KI3]